MADRFTYVASDNTTGDAQVLGEQDQDIFVKKVIFGTPTNSKYIRFFNKRVQFTGGTADTAAFVTQPTAAAGKDWVREVDFTGTNCKGLRLDGGSFFTDDSQVTVIWEPVEESS